ncbi:biotin synthase [Rodentibacter pneumotropicus]|nr:biotin synthase [Rodentibacter pneumotropicus]
MTEEMQAMCFMAGANSIFYGDKLLVTDNPEEDGDQLLMAKLDLEPETEENRKILER